MLKNRIVKFFSEEQNVLAFVTTKEAGDFKGNIEKIKELLGEIGIEKNKIAMPDLVHGRRLFKVEKNNFSSGELIEKTDSVLTKEKSIFLVVTFADCFPIFVFDKNSQEIGLIHAGWRSVSQNLIESTLKALNIEEKNNTKIVIGPGIDAENYEFDFETAQENFSAYPKRIIKSKKENKCYLNLRGIIKDKLQKAGITEKNIFDCGINTFTDKRFFSARKDKFSPNNVKACAAGIMLL